MRRVIWVTFLLLLPAAAWAERYRARLARTSSFVRIIPPAPPVMTLLPLKLSTHSRWAEPTGRPL